MFLKVQGLCLTMKKMLLDCYLMQNVYVGCSLGVCFLFVNHGSELHELLSMAVEKVISLFLWRDEF